MSPDQRKQGAPRRPRSTAVAFLLMASLMAMWFSVSPRDFDSVQIWLEGRQPHYSEFNFVMTNHAAPECRSLSAEEIGFTLVTQTSANRLWLLEEHCRRWGPHPISITIGGPGLKEGIILPQIQSLPSCNLDHIVVNLVTDFDGDLDYPVNRMRNIAIAAVLTSHVVYVDMDFLLSDHVYENLMAHRKPLEDVRTALLLPAFELLSYCEIGSVEGNATCIAENLARIPKNKEEARNIYIKPKGKKESGGITQFDSKWNKHGHASTDYEKWLLQDESTVEPLTCVTSDKYEPYLVFRKCQDVPEFPEAFSGFGRNKIVWVQQLRRAGWKFLRMGGSFVTHLPHDKSNAFNKWRATNKAHQRNLVDAMSESFRQWMIEQVPDDSQMKYCNASLPPKFIWYPDASGVDSSYR
jgi:hypothetical protein